MENQIQETTTALTKIEPIFPNLETEILCSQIEHVDGLTAYDVKGALLSTIPTMASTYKLLLNLGISRIDWEFVDIFLRTKPHVDL